MTITIADGRGALWQWDTGRRVKITDGDGVKQIHYQNRCFGRSVDVDVGTDGTAIIPDELLQDWHPLTAYVYVTDDTGAYTMVQQDFAVHKRPKPSDYVYTPTEHAGFDRLRAEIGNLDDLTTEDKSTIVAAINEAAASGGSPNSEFVINAALAGSDQCTVDKTYAQIREAVQSGKNPVVHFASPDGTAVMPLTLDFGVGFVFRVTLSVDDGVTSQIGQYIISVLQDGRVIFSTSAAPSLNSDGNLAQQTMAKDPTADMQIATKKYVDTHAAGSGGGGIKYQIGNGLILDAKTNTLAVDTADAVERDNTKPITSAGVYLEIGNINALLATI